MPFPAILFTGINFLTSVIVGLRPPTNEFAASGPGGEVVGGVEELQSRGVSGAIPPVVLRGARRPHVSDASLAEGVTAEEVGWQPLCHTLPLQLVLLLSSWTDSAYPLSLGLQPL